MRYILDTHTVIWYFGNSLKLPNNLRDLIDNSENTVYISSASLWEIAIKTSLEKLKLSSSFDDLLNTVNDYDYNILQIKHEYLRIYYNLPLLHRDPFDRLLISTAISENLTLITKDENIQKYDVPWIWN